MILKNIRRIVAAVVLPLPALVSAQISPTEFFIGSAPKQMFVQRWAPNPTANKRAIPLIMIHGGLHTGTGFVTTPDGRPGWAPLFARGGWDVYVVDWPGVGRSGFLYPQNLDTSVLDVRDSLLQLIERTGPAVLVGHSLGGGISFKVAEKSPEKVLGVVALAPASVEMLNNAVPSASLDKQVTIEREQAKSRFANSALFPIEAFENYFSSLVPYSPRIRNAGVGATGDLRLDRGRLSIWKQIPVLFLTAEDDKTVPAQVSQVTADLMGIPTTALGKDWNMPGHGHLFAVEKNSEKIAERVQEWLSKNRLSAKVID